MRIAHVRDRLVSQAFDIHQWVYISSPGPVDIKDRSYFVGRLFRPRLGSVQALQAVTQLIPSPRWPPEFCKHLDCILALPKIRSGRFYHNHNETAGVPLYKVHNF